MFVRSCKWPPGTTFSQETRVECYCTLKLCAALCLVRLDVMFVWLRNDLSCCRDFGEEEREPWQFFPSKSREEVCFSEEVRDIWTHLPLGEGLLPPTAVRATTRTIVGDLFGKFLPS